MSLSYAKLSAVTTSFKCLRFQQDPSLMTHTAGGKPLKLLAAFKLVTLFHHSCIKGAWRPLLRIKQTVSTQFLQYNAVLRHQLVNPGCPRPVLTFRRVFLFLQLHKSQSRSLCRNCTCGKLLVWTVSQPCAKRVCGYLGRATHIHFQLFPYVWSLSYTMEARCDKTVLQEQGSTQWSKLLLARRLATVCFESIWRFRSRAATRALHEDWRNSGRTVWFSTEAIDFMADSLCCGWLGKSHWRWVYHSRLLSRCRQGIRPSGPHPSWTHTVDCRRANQGALLVCQLPEST